MTTSAHRELLERLYTAYNTRDLQTLIAGVSEDVDWPDGETRLHGRAAVGDYWARQWSRIHTHDEVIEFIDLDPQRVVAHVRQVVRNLDGVTISTGLFEHTFVVRDALVARLDLRGLDRPDGTGGMADSAAMVRRLYAGFNRRDIAAVFAMLDDEVDWANGMTGGHEHGLEAVRAYWTKQWAGIQPHVEPLEITQRDDGTTAVEVHQVVHDLQGNLLLDERVRHVFRIVEGRVTRFDIENAGGLSRIAHD